MQDRKLKVHKHGDMYKQKHGCQRLMSKLILQGNWLVEAGFQPGCTAHLRVCDGHITIYKEERNETT